MANENTVKLSLKPEFSDFFKKFVGLQKKDGLYAMNMEDVIVSAGLVIGGLFVGQKLRSDVLKKPKQFLLKGGRR